MKKSLSFFAVCILIAIGTVGTLFSQSSTGNISGTVFDEGEAVIAGAEVTIKNPATGISLAATTNSDGRYRFVNIPTGTYEVTVGASNFSTYFQKGITLDSNQSAVVDTTLKAGNVQEVVTVTENASGLNTTTAEVSTRFDSRRLAELPISPNGSVFNVLLSVPGVSQLGPNQTSFAMGISFSSNGGRIRSNNFLLDGQDVSDPVLSGVQIPLNNPEALAEVRIITNQFLAEYGHNSGSVVNFIGKSGTNDYNGSAFVFFNGENFNACSNLNRAAGFCDPRAATKLLQNAPPRKELRYGFTFGGPLTFPWFGNGGGPVIWKGTDKTFFFGDYLRWTDRRIVTSNTLNGAPSTAGRATLQQFFGHLPQVQALLAFVPAGTSNFRNVTAGGHTIQVGSFTGSAPASFDEDQGSFRIDHRFNDRNFLYGRYRGSKSVGRGEGQITPPGLTTVTTRKTNAAAIVWNSIISDRISNEARIAWTRFDVDLNAEDPSSGTIPSIEINELGLVGFNTSPTRTAFGLAVNLPVIRVNDTYQITESLAYVIGDHALKFGVDFRRTNVSTIFLPTTRGRLVYTTLDRFLLDSAQTASITFPLPGNDIQAFYRWKEFYAFAQDEWKVQPNLPLRSVFVTSIPGIRSAA